MTVRLASHLQVAGLLRLVGTRGGTGAVLARGDREAGGILLLLADRGHPISLRERTLDISGSYRWAVTGPKDIQGYQELNTYIERRCRSDTDLWVVELDVAGAERFAAEALGPG